MRQVCVGLEFQRFQPGAAQPHLFGPVMTLMVLSRESTGWFKGAYHKVPRNKDEREEASRTNRLFKRCPTGAGEVTPSAKCWLCDHEYLHLDRQQPCKSWVRQHTCNPSIGEVRRGGVRFTKGVRARFSGRACF